MPDLVAIATWPFGRTAAAAARDSLRRGDSALDAAIAGAQAVEDDPEVQSVGYGGIPNAAGQVQLDASVMEGTTLGCGAVAGVENIRHVAALARRVMERTPHVMLVGNGARDFAIQQGFPLENLNTPAGLAEYHERLSRREGRPIPKRQAAGLAAHPLSHDTVVVLVRGGDGRLAGACSTSGLCLKLPGRVGDSPLIGHGLYVDDEGGAAGGTGVGEEVIRAGGSLLIVEAMRHGTAAQAACEEAVLRLNRVALRRGVHPPEVAFLAIDPQGRVGAASTPGTSFEYAIARAEGVEMALAPNVALPER